MGSQKTMTGRAVRRALLVFALAWGALSPLASPAALGQEQEGNPPEAKQPESDLDALMAKALKRREMDWDRLHNYLFSERETLELRGFDATPLESLRRDYVWLVRDGYLIRSPIRVNGVAISQDEQAKAERQWIEQQKKRKKSGSLERESFYGFRFQPGRYLLAGRRAHEGREVLVVEYFPKVSDKKSAAGQGEPKDPKEDYYEEMFEKTLLVTMLVDPAENQIVQLTFDNVGLDFLPGRWLARISELKAVMDMHKAFGEVWLPRSISAGGSVVTANGSFELRYSREFSDYQETEVRVKFWYEKPTQEKP
jgi:hypothetical protein